MSRLIKPSASIDGAHATESHTRKATGSPVNEDLCCIFVHAGAGYHSLVNEQIHLEACNEYVTGDGVKRSKAS